LLRGYQGVQLLSDPQASQEQCALVWHGCSFSSAVETKNKASFPENMQQAKMK
jgi:hypothetical protein